MWPFGKIEWKTVKIPLSFLDDPAATESMTIDFEAVGNPDGLCRFFYATYSYPGGEASFEDYEKLRKLLREVEGAHVDVELKFRNGALRDFKMTPEALAVATGCDACRRLELLGWGINERSANRGSLSNGSGSAGTDLAEPIILGRREEDC